MKPKTLIPMAIIIAVLGGLVFLRSLGDESFTLVDEVKLTKLLPDDLSLDAITKLEIYNGGATEEILELLKEAGEEGWVVASHFDAPVTGTKIDTFLGDLFGLRGEFRAAGGEDSFGTYDLAEESAFHIKGYTGDGEALGFHLLVGKAPGIGNRFVRAAGEAAIYVADVDLRQRAGLYTDESADPPTPDSWLDKKILELEKTDITKVALTMPGKALAFEYQQKSTEAPEEQPDGEDAAAPTPTPAIEYEWVLASGGGGRPLKDAGLQGILSKIATMGASDIVDPTKKDEYGLIKPAFGVRVGLMGDADEIVIEAGHPDDGSDGYVRVASRDKDVVYKVTKFNFEQLFPKGSTLFDLPRVSFDLQDITEINLTSPDGTATLVNERNAWNIIDPMSDLPVLASKLTGIATTLAAWQADDYFDSPDGSGLASPERTVTFKIANGPEQTIEVGGENESTGGRYARLNGMNAVLGISASDVSKVFPELKDLFERDLFDIDELDIQAIEITRTATLRLDRNPTGWSITAGGLTTNAKAGTADALALAIAQLQADDLIFGAARMQGGFLASVGVFMSDGTEKRFNVEIAQADGTHPVTVPGLVTTFVLNADTAAGILLTENDLRDIAPVSVEVETTDVAETPSAP